MVGSQRDHISGMPMAANHGVQVRSADANSGAPDHETRCADRVQIWNTSRPGDIVVDPFGGSGSRLLGCEQNARSCRTMEIDPKYSHVMLERWANFTGKDPVRQDGSMWSILKPQRSDVNRMYAARPSLDCCNL